MKTEFQTRAFEFAASIKPVFDDTSWNRPLTQAFEAIEFTPAQMEMIRAAASPTCLQGIDSAEDRVAVELAHAMHDPVLKGLHLFGFLNILEWEDSSQSALQTLARAVPLRQALRDIVHNLPLMLKNGIPPEIAERMKQIDEELLPELDAIIEQAQQEGEFDLDIILEEHSGGRECIAALPDNFLEL